MSKKSFVPNPHSSGGKWNVTIFFTISDTCSSGGGGKGHIYNEKMQRDQWICWEVESSMDEWWIHQRAEMGKQTSINSDGSCRHRRVCLNGQEQTDEGGTRRGQTANSWLGIKPWTFCMWARWWVHPFHWHFQLSRCTFSKLVIVSGSNHNRPQRENRLKELTFKKKGVIASVSLIWWCLRTFWLLSKQRIRPSQLVCVRA